MLINLQNIYWGNIKINQSHADSRDNPQMITTHIYLLIGLSYAFLLNPIIDISKWYN